MDMKVLVKQIIFALQLENPVETQKIAVQQLLMFLNKLWSEDVEKVDPTLFGKLDTLRREITVSGLNSERSAMLINEIISSVRPKFPWGPDLLKTAKGVKLGQLLDAAGAGFKVGKSMLRKMTDTPSLSMTGVAKVVLNKKEKTLTYLNEDGEPTFIVRDYVPSEVKVEIREGDDV